MPFIRTPETAGVKPAELLAPTGTLRAAINFGNPVLAQHDAATGEARGVSVDLARELARRATLPVALIPYDTARAVFEASGSNAWDIAFLAIDPARATRIRFTAPYVIIEGGYVVRADSPVHAIGDIDRPGVRIAAADRSAYDLFLTRTLSHAELVRAPTGEAALQRFLRDRLEALAGVKAALRTAVEADPQLRLIDGRFMAIEQAVGVPKRGDDDAAWRYVCAFIEDAKASGLVADALERSGQRDAVVAPAAP
jgi:polar amino acid transport system substrate-binding protein